jgi:DNA-binding winged helix-turn-helix (wHTH) protein
VTESSLKIGRFQLHPTQGLSLGNREIRVTPKSLAVLGVLATRPGLIVTKQELLENVWGDTIVTDASLSS